MNDPDLLRRNRAPVRFLLQLAATRANAEIEVEEDFQLGHGGGQQAVRGSQGPDRGALPGPTCRRGADLHRRPRKHLPSRPPLNTRPSKRNTTRRARPSAPALPPAATRRGKPTRRRAGPSAPFTRPVRKRSRMRFECCRNRSRNPKTVRHGFGQLQQQAQETLEKFGQGQFNNSACCFGDKCPKLCWSIF